MDASRAATGMLEVLATRAVLFMMLSTFPPTSMVSCRTNQSTVRHSELRPQSQTEQPHFRERGVSHLGEIAQDLRHLVPSLTAAHVDDDVTVGVFGQRLRDDGLATPESPGDGRGPALYTPAT